MQSQKEKIKKVCRMPFSRLDILPYGETYCCCSEFSDLYSFGNIYNQPLEEILHGERITKFRKSILNGEYKYCNTKMCSGFVPDQMVTVEEALKMQEKYPRDINLTLDTACNAKCVMCRDENIPLEKDIKEKVKPAIKDIFIPLLKNAELLVINCDGEFFISKESMDLVKTTSKLYPNLKYEILTNGILCTPKKLQELGILNKIRRVTLSLHASTPETHERIVRIKNKFYTVMKNIEDLTKLRDEQIIEDFGLVFVLSSLNYKDLLGYAELLEKYQIGGDVWEFRDWGVSKMCHEYDKYDVTNPKHPEYNQLLEILKNPLIQSPLLYKNDKIEQLYNIANNINIRTK